LPDLTQGENFYSEEDDLAGNVVFKFADFHAHKLKKVTENPSTSVCTK